MDGVGARSRGRRARRLAALTSELRAERGIPDADDLRPRSNRHPVHQHRDASELPSVGQIMEAITAGEIDGTEYDAAYPERLRTTIY